MPSGERHRASRLHVGGKLSFRGRKRGSEEAAGDLPLVELQESPPRLEELVPHGCSTIEVEVGPGKGAFLVAAAAARPESFWLGIEASPGYARLAAARLAASGRHNGLLLVDNARLYLEDRVPEGALARVHVYFPDPWPKRRHRKRRFFAEGIGEILERVLAPGGQVLVATDNAAYAGQICRVLGDWPGLARDEAEEERLAAMPPGHAFTPTNFETKYRQEQRIIRRYVFRRR